MKLIVKERLFFVVRTELSDEEIIQKIGNVHCTNMVIVLDGNQEMGAQVLNQ